MSFPLYEELSANLDLMTKSTYLPFPSVCPSQHRLGISMALDSSLLIQPLKESNTAYLLTTLCVPLFCHHTLRKSFIASCILQTGKHPICSNIQVPTNMQLFIIVNKWQLFPLQLFFSPLIAYLPDLHTALAIYMFKLHFI